MTRKGLFINVVIPAFNEEAALAYSVHKVVAFLAARCSYAREWVMAENASTDGMISVAYTERQGHRS